MHFSPGGVDHLSFELFGDDNHSINVGEDQVAGSKTDTIDFDRHIKVDDALAMFAVINTCCSSENGKPNFFHLAHITDGAINDGANASPIHRSSREQLSPDAGA